MTRRASAFVAALLLVGACADLIPAPPGPVLSGTWGGDNAGAIVSDSGAHVHIGCTAGDAGQPFISDSTGHFAATGRYNVQLYPIAVGPDHPALFSGTIAGNVMLLTVALTDTAVTLGPVRLVYGKEPVMGPCPICRRPGEPRAMIRGRP